MVRTSMLKVFLAVFIFYAISCTNLAEHEMTFNAGLHIISSGDFSTINTLSELRGARSLLIQPGNVFVASTEGVIYRYDSETMELVDEYQIDAPSPAGFSQMVYCSLKNTAYITGSMGKILEISLPECTVIDEFNICQSPVKLALGAESGYLFVADGPSSQVYQVHIDDNRSYDYVSMYYTILCMEPAQNPDSMLVGTSDGISLIEVLSPTQIRTVGLNTDRPFPALACVPDDTVFVGVTGDYSNLYVGMVDVFIPGFEWPQPDEFYASIGISGITPFLAMGQDWQHAYVLSYIGDNTSRLVSYNYRFYTIDQEIDISGYPLDLKVSGSGVIYALTAE